MADEKPVRVIEPANPEEVLRLRQVLEHFANAMAHKLIAQGVSRKLIVRAIDETIRSMFGEKAGAIDMKAMMGEAEEEGRS